MQLRQNTSVIRSSARQSIAARASEFQLAVAQNDELLAVVTKLFRHEELSPREEVRLHFFFGCLFRAAEEAFLQHREGFLEDEYWNKRGNLMLNYLRYPGVLESWKDRLRSTYHSAFVDWVESQFPRDATSHEGGPVRQTDARSIGGIDQ